MDGLINLYKPSGPSSAAALYRVRKLTGQRKSGHAGTLDPLAEGVLILCLGKATRLVERLMDQPKVYRATARLDVTSASFDSDRPLEPVAVSAAPTDVALRAAVTAEFGLIQQIPPAISALKIGGRPAYRIVRGGQTPRMVARPVWLHWAVVHRYAWPELEFEICCGRGFYVRALIRDIGARLGVGGCLTRLIRSQVGPFRASEAATLEGLAERGSEPWLLPLEAARALVSRVDPIAPPDAGQPPAVRPAEAPRP
jgi:tRNA pseudouridine55 synthase